MCRPQNPADWILFQNLVDLLEDVLKSINSKERLKDSVSKFNYTALLYYSKI